MGRSDGNAAIVGQPDYTPLSIIAVFFLAAGLAHALEHSSDLSVVAGTLQWEKIKSWGEYSDRISFQNS